ncbi:hypothetical protein X275_08285 [Marinitoga sp. 1197]|uniref:hypothetical protein n=1 Tax=Marinitoga sp. 1197 TaxID=1428449 RepID=UPI000640DB1C|nr:hypothetical protein [Marinitoga sp. 1197]KLO21879.1 hypothetical protein X275_08285 [Marinitoga sp. 1197]
MTEYERGYENALMRVIRIAENIEDRNLLIKILDLIYEVYKIEKGDQHTSMPTANTKTHANESDKINYSRKSLELQEGGEIVQRKQSN